MSNSFKTNIGEGDAECEVFYEYDPADAGDYYQPPEPECAYITKVLYKGLDIMDALESNTVSDLEDKACQNELECYNAYIEARAEEQYENMKLAMYEH